MKTCTFCGSNNMDQRLNAHYLCAARFKLNLPTPKSPKCVPVEAKVFQGQLFEKINGKWTKVLG